jgi:uncharacterized protein (TIGR02996 family)
MKGQEHPQTPGPSSLRDALEAALVENPDDTAAHMAYADWLTEQGDPKGELIHVQMRLEQEDLKAPERKKLTKREGELLAKHGQEWFGELAEVILRPFDKAQYWLRVQVKPLFRRGWLDGLDVHQLDVAFSRLLARSPATRLLRRLRIINTAHEEVGEYEPGPDIPEDGESSPALYPLTRATNLSNVRVLQLGEQVPKFLKDQGRDMGYNCHMPGEAAVDLVKVMPKLEELYLLAHAVDTAQLFSLQTLHHLRILQVYHLHEYPLARLAKNPSLGQLTHLLIHPGAVSDLGDLPISLKGLRAVVRSRHLPSLTHLQLRLTTFGDRGIEEMVTSGLLKRLKFLDLRGGTVSDEGARVLAACPDVKNLQILDLSRNRLTDEGTSALRATGVTLWAHDQWEGGEGDLEGDENSFIYEGDWE